MHEKNKGRVSELYLINICLKRTKILKYFFPSTFFLVWPETHTHKKHTTLGQSFWPIICAVTKFANFSIMIMYSKLKS